MAERTANALSDHVIVCGLGHVGYRVVSLLSRLGQPFSVIARPTNEEWMRAVGAVAPLFEGDARDDQLLRAAGVARARALVAVTDDDHANVLIALDARRLNPELAIVVRLFDQQLAPLIEASIGATRALSASGLAAPAFVAAALGAGARAAFDFGGLSGLIEEIVVGETAAGTPATVQTALAEAGGRDTIAAVARRRGDEVVLAPGASLDLIGGDRLIFARLASTRERVRSGRRRFLDAPLTLLSGLREWWRETPSSLRILLGVLGAVVLASVAFFHLALGLAPIDALYFVITTVTTTGYGDINLMTAPWYVKLFGIVVMLSGAATFAVLFSIATDLLLRTRFAEILARGRARQQGHIVVAGIGTIGYRVVRELRRRGENVVAIERNEATEFIDPARSLATVILGNARAEETQRRAGLPGAKAVVAVTDDDLTNLGIGLAAKSARADARVVLRVFDAVLAEKMQGRLGVEAVLSTSAVAAPAFVGATLCPEAVTGFVLGDHLVVLTRRTVGAPGFSPAAAGGERALLVRSAGQTGLRLLSADECPAPGDDVLGVRWYALGPATLL
jgi:Trk K+ transport system NAD-binding subunit